MAYHNRSMQEMTCHKRALINKHVHEPFHKQQVLPIKCYVYILNTRTADCCNFKLAWCLGKEIKQSAMKDMHFTLDSGSTSDAK